MLQENTINMHNTRLQGLYSYRFYKSEKELTVRHGLLEPGLPHAILQYLPTALKAVL